MGLIVVLRQCCPLSHNSLCGSLQLHCSTMQYIISHALVIWHWNEYRIMVMVYAYWIKLNSIQTETYNKIIQDWNKGQCIWIWPFEEKTIATCQQVWSGAGVAVSWHVPHRLPYNQYEQLNIKIYQMIAHRSMLLTWPYFWKMNICALLHCNQLLINIFVRVIYLFKITCTGSKDSPC